MDLAREKTYAFENGFEKGKESGLNEGQEKKAIEDALAFLKENVSAETIAKCVKLPLEKVLELQESITSPVS